MTSSPGDGTQGVLKLGTQNTHRGTRGVLSPGVGTQGVISGDPRCTQGVLKLGTQVARKGYSRVLTEYSRGTRGVLMGYSRSTHGVLEGYSSGTSGQMSATFAASALYTLSAPSRPSACAPRLVEYPLEYPLEYSSRERNACAALCAFLQMQRLAVPKLCSSI